MQFDYHDNLNEIVGTLSEGDRVIIDNRTHPMDVVETAREEIGFNMHETTVVYLSFRGRTYRLRGEYHGDGDDSTPPMLEIRKEGKWDSISHPVNQIKVVGGSQIISDTRAGEWLAEDDIDVR